MKSKKRSVLETGFSAVAKPNPAVIAGRKARAIVGAALRGRISHDEARRLLKALGNA